MCFSASFKSFLSNKRIKNNINNNSVPMYYVANAIPPIVSREMWERAQEIRINRFHVQMGQDQNASKYLNKYPYSGLLMCMKCGSGFKRRYWNYGYASQRIVLQCSNHIKDKESCIKGSIDLEALNRCTKKVINKIFKKKKDIVNDIVAENTNGKVVGSVGGMKDKNGNYQISIYLYFWSYKYKFIII